MSKTKTAHFTQGSWFPSGYYGHFRSKSRNDFVNEYRQQAKPSPPEKFTRKLTARPTLHHFSHHDNRFSFLNTVTSFQDGLGKKKVQHQRTGKFTPDFISWVPHKREIREAGPVSSVYRETYRNSDKSRVPQVLVPTVSKPPKQLSASAPAFLPTPYSDPADMVQENPVTSYQISHRHLQPNPTVHTNMNTGRVEEDPVPLQKTHVYINPKIDSIYDRPKQRGSLTSLRRARTGSAPLFRSSVADCMRWHVPHEPTPPRPKTVTGTFPEVRGAETGSPEEIRQPMPPQTSGKGTVCPTTAWTTPSQSMPEQSRMDASVDTRPMGQTHNGQMSGMDTSYSSSPSASADVPMAE
ncbi:uncharacterized protein [Asterias amurensis]|uniref:uncharacterized protein n=1 Tax=Asterias amurensis TaxID=7602 RepID=UPI003AB2D714